MLHCKKILSFNPVVIPRGPGPSIWFFEMSTLLALQLSAPSAAPLATVLRGTGGPLARAPRSRTMGSEHIYRADAALRAIGLIDYPSR